MKDVAEMYTHAMLLKPTIDALVELGRSGTNEEIEQKIIKNLGVSDEILNIRQGESNISKFSYRLAWARTALKNMGILVNTSRGVWSIAPNYPDATQLTEAYLAEEHRKLREKEAAERARRIQQQDQPEAGEGEEEEEEETFQDWKDELLTILQSINPAGFEKLALLLLRDAGFVQLEITGRSHDGGIDGRGVLKLNDLFSIPVLIQCKRYSKSVSSGEIRDFRGALEGRADKGIFITTGTFSQDAKREAQREGAKPIETIDGGALIDLMKKYKLGVDVEMVEKVTVKPEWFIQFGQ